MSVVQSLWVGASLPEIQRLSVQSFLAHGHKYQLYTYGDVDGVPAGATVCDASTILPADSIFCYQEGFGKGSYSAFSNLFRYKLLFERGGWWVDTDLVCLKPLGFDNPFVFATEYDDDFTLQAATCAFKSPARAPFLSYCIDVVLSKDRSTLQWGEIGPRLLDEALTRFELREYLVPVETFNPINFFEFRSITEAGFDMSRLARSHAVHLWNQMWKAGATDPSAGHEPDSLFAHLRKSYPAAQSQSWT
jgi:hypothetical protein